MRGMARERRRTKQIMINLLPEEDERLRAMAGPLPVAIFAREPRRSGLGRRGAPGLSGVEDDNCAHTPNPRHHTCATSRQPRRDLKICRQG
jgi:hypothetical protein